MLDVASFNIFWYPASQVAQNKRDKEDEGRIAHVLKNLAADVVVFQEILDIAHLENLVKGVRDSYSLRKSPEGDWLASGSVSSTKSMKIACAYDTSTLELVRGAGLEDPVSQRRFKGRRYPYALHLRHRDTGWEFTVVGVHFKSGLPVGDPPPNADDDKRMDEVEYLAGWLAGDAETGTGNFERPPTTDVIVIGDFNAVENHHSLSELRKGVLEPWYRPEAKVLASLGVNPETLEDTTERWTTYLDRMVDQKTGGEDRGNPGWLELYDLSLHTERCSRAGGLRLPGRGTEAGGVGYIQ